MIFLLILICIHFLFDFVLVTDKMLESKAHGHIPGIFRHALCHASVSGIFALFFNTPFIAVVFSIILLLSHFYIDYTKYFVGYLNPSTTDITKRSFWAVLGADQLAHHIVLILLVFLWC